MVGALDGVRVLDFSRVLAAPLATMMLADMGAEVIKIEHPEGGDDTRAWGPPWAGDDETRMSAYFLSVNRNKASVTLNLKTAGGQAVARQLVAQSDIVVENFKVGQMAKFGLDYETLVAINPRLVYCSVTGFGQTGVYRERAGYDYVIQAMSGLMSITGAVEGHGDKVGVAIADVVAGLHAVGAILGALRHAERTGEGQYIDISLFSTQLASLVNVASNYLVSGDVPMRYGHQHPNIVPYQTFEASDGAFVCAVGNDRQFGALCRIIGREAWASDARYATNPSRVAHRDALVAELASIFKTASRAHWVGALLDAGIPTGEIQTVAEALEDEHTTSEGLVETWTLANGVSVRGLGPALSLGGTPTSTRRPPPLLGQDTEVVLREVLGMDDDGIETLRQGGCL